MGMQLQSIETTNYTHTWYLFPLIIYQLHVRLVGLAAIEPMENHVMEGLELKH